MPSIAARLNRLPITRTHRTIVAIAGIGTFFDLFDIFLAGVLGTILTEQFALSRVALPAVLGSGFLGMFVGAVSLGTLADRVGRRRSFLVTLGIYSLFTLAGAFATSAGVLIVLRFAAGIGIGAEPPLVDAYLGEMLPPHARGRYSALAYTFGFLAVPIVGLLARVLVPLAPFGIAGWRWLFVAGGLGGAIVWVLRRQLPESPRWLESAGRIEEADAIARQLEAEASRHGTLSPPVDGERPIARSAGPFALFAREYRRRTLVLCVFHLFQTVGYYGFGTLVPIILAAKGFTVVHSLTYTTLVLIGYPVGSALSVPIVERVDRRWMIVGGAVLMAVFGVALGFAASPLWIVASGFSYTVVSNVFSNAFHVFQAEIFPTFMRTTAAGTAYALSRLSSAAMPFVLLPVLNDRGAPAMFGVVALAMLVVIVDIGLFAPSTTGRTLEQVATEIHPPRPRSRVRG
jgi:MFS transporter, putative metabolite:H+ symporter